MSLEETTDVHNDSRYAQYIDLSERENANSLEVINTLLGEEVLDDRYSYEDLQTTVIADNLKKISDDLDNRWRGAIFS